MKKIFTQITALVLVMNAMAQQHFNDSLAQNRNQLTEKAMVTLGSWAAANIISGFVIAGQTYGDTKYFWQMNAYWNFINGGLAIMGYIGARKAMAEKYGYAKNEAAQRSMEKLYAFNFGLDLAYMAGGLYLTEKGTNADSQKSRDQFRGYGNSIIMQGGFLLLMDGIMYSLHHKNSVKLNKKLQSLELNTGPNGLGLSYHF